MAGPFIVLEGGEGCGKTTQARLLYRRLQEEGHAPLLLHEPGGTPLGEQVRRLLMAERGSPGRRQPAMEAVTELLLFSAARAELVSTVLRPALEAGRAVVCDRFTPSTIAYQGYGRGISLDTIRVLNHLATGGLAPDLTVLLDLPPEEALPRISAQRPLLDTGEGETGAPSGRQDQEGLRRFEQEPLTFHRKVRQGYLGQARAAPERWLVLDGTLPPERIGEVVWERVKGLLSKV